MKNINLLSVESSFSGLINNKQMKLFMKTGTLCFLIILLSFMNPVKAQTKILIYSENFENGAPGVTLNTTGVGNNSGTNEWIINNKYNGYPLYPNNPDEYQTTSGTISHGPYSHYLHIYDQNADTGIPPDTIANCNYNPANASDRFVTLPTVCTLGLTGVNIVFFHFGLGSSSAYAQLYYSANYGPWLAVGKILNNTPIWTYEMIQNPAFDNLVNLQFGFRWVNDASSDSGNSSIGIDDIFIEGDFDNNITNFNVLVDSISPFSVCQNNAVNVYLHLTNPLCGQGFVVFQLSDSTGNFSVTPTQLAIYQINNQASSGSLSVTIPAETPPGHCYKIRVEYYDTYYGLDFFTQATDCFTVKHCPNSIQTLQPVITYGSTPPGQIDSVCVGSVIIVPFWSWGVFKNDNKYIAQLSDSSGNFPADPNIIGTSPDKNTYDTALVPSPGSVSGIISETRHKIPNGCNYYIRVISTDPTAVGSVWGPFCIKHCDIETNHKKSIQACLHSCAYSPDSFNVNVYVKIHQHDTSTIYNPNNQFEVQLLDPMYFSVVCTGCLGKITAVNDSTLNLHIPCVDSLAYLNLQPGVYYMRLIATSSNHPINMDGTLIFLTIGAPSDNLYIAQYPSDSVYCIGSAVYFYPIPYNAGPPINSTYEWKLNGQFFSSRPSIGILFTGTGTFNLTVQETNYGCKGPVAPNNTKLYILGTPGNKIKGPLQVCEGDTIVYTDLFEKDVYYQWSASGGTIIDTSNVEIKIRFDEEGIYTIYILGLNKCGQSNGSIQILATNCSGGINTINNKTLSINLFPNPAKNELNIEINNTHKNQSRHYGIEILNSIGKVLYKSNITDRKAVNVSGFAEGIYIVRLYSDDSSHTKMFIKQQ
jgi:hypothetical protein